MRIEQFSKRYKSTHISLESVRSRAKVTVFTGPNGVGKTTVLKALATLIAYEGKAMCQGTTMYAEESFRYPDAMQTGEYLMLLQRLGQGNHARMNALIDVFGLCACLEKPLSALSKGFKQKVNLVQALMEDVDTYVLDEPLSGLDQNSQEKLFAFIEKDEKKYIIATHRWTDKKAVRGKAVAL